MSRTPLYKQAETEMLRRIADGDWPPGHRLGNEFELAAEFGVSQGTMRRALISVEGMGYLSRKPGRGTIVAEPEPETPSAAPASLTGPGGAPLELEPFRASVSTRDAESEETALFGDTRLYVLKRVLKQDGARFALDEVAIPTALAPAPEEDSPSALSDLLQEIGLTAASIEDQIHAEQISTGDSVTLQTDRHAPLLCLTRIARDAEGAVIARQILRMAGPAQIGVLSAA